MNNYRKVYLLDGRFNNLPNTEVEILSCVARQKSSCTAKEIVEFLNVSKALVSQKIDFLVSEGYLIKKIDPDDKRSHFLFLGEKSKPLANDLIDFGDKFFQMIKFGIRDEDLQIFNKVMKKMANNIENEIEKINEHIVK